MKIRVGFLLLLAASITARMRASLMKRSRNSMGSMPALAASSSIIDCSAKACGIPATPRSSAVRNGANCWVTCCTTRLLGKS